MQKLVGNVLLLFLVLFFDKFRKFETCGKTVLRSFSEKKIWEVSGKNLELGIFIHKGLEVSAKIFSDRIKTARKPIFAHKHKLT